MSSESGTGEAEASGGFEEDQDGRAGRSLGETSPRHTWPPPLLFFQDALGIRPIQRPCPPPLALLITAPSA